VRRIGKAGRMRGLGARRAARHLADRIAQPQPEPVAADRQPDLAAKEVGEPTRRERHAGRKVRQLQAPQRSGIEQVARPRHPRVEEAARRTAGH
jgi:hypothetical protein